MWMVLLWWISTITPWRFGIAESKPQQSAVHTITVPGPVECRFTTVNKNRRATYAAVFSHQHDVWEIVSARTLIATGRQRART
jgi:hypothetical protein